MTIILNPSVLPDAQTTIYISDYVEVVEEISNLVQSIANTVNVTFSVAQPGVTVNVGDNKIWFNGYYTTGQSEGIFYVEAPFGNIVQNTPSSIYNFAGVPKRRYVYKVLQPNPTGITVTHTIDVLVSNANTTNAMTLTADRLVYPSIYNAYDFLTSYEWYTEE